jgi:ABC-2 type transport system permease protein
LLSPSPPDVRRLGAVNWLGFWTLYIREVRRFLKVYTQTIVAPVVTTLLFLAVFLLALGGAQRVVGDIPFAEFLVPGLVMMAMAQNSFANTSSSIVISKVQGNIVDVLMPPLSPAEFTLAYTLGGTTRGVVVGLAVTLAMWVFVPLYVLHPGFAIFHAIAASLLLSTLGMVGGIWSEKFDHIAAVTNFVVTPLSLLSGTFYSVNQLAPTFRAISHGNPFFYVISGFRAGFLGTSDSPLLVGAVGLLVLNIVLWAVCFAALKSGWKIKN